MHTVIHTYTANTLDTYMHAYTLCPQIHTYIHTYIHTFCTYIHSCIHILKVHTYTHKYIHSHIHAYIHLRSGHTYMHTYIHTLKVHTYIHTYIQNIPELSWSSASGSKWILLPIFLASRASFFNSIYIRGMYVYNVCIYVCIYVRMNVYNVCMYMYVYVCTCVGSHRVLYICMYVLCMYVYI